MQAASRQDIDESAIVLGRIGVAKLALVHGLKGEARANIKSAIDAAQGLRPNTPKFSMAFGLLSYKTSSGEGRSFVPLVGGAFSARMLDEKLLKSGATKTELTDAEVTHAQVGINGDAVKAGLQKSEEALRRGQGDAALAVLNGITDAALTPSETAQGTLQLARDSLMLAQQLLKDRDFRAAAFAAGHAREALSAAADTDSVLKAKAADTNKAIKGLDDLGDSIRSGRTLGQKSPEAAASELARQLEGLAPKG